MDAELSLVTAVAAPLPFVRKTCRLLAEAEDVIILTGPTLGYAQRKQERQIPQIHSRSCLFIHQRPSTREMVQHRKTQFHSLKLLNCLRGHEIFNQQHLHGEVPMVKSQYKLLLICGENMNNVITLFLFYNSLFYYTAWTVRSRLINNNFMGSIPWGKCTFSAQ